MGEHKRKRIKRKEGRKKDREKGMKGGEILEACSQELLDFQPRCWEWTDEHVKSGRFNSPTSHPCRILWTKMALDCGCLMFSKSI